jgi:hypothetical protein
MTRSSVSAITVPPVLHPARSAAADSRGRLRELLITSFAGDALAVTSGLALASWLRFATPHHSPTHCATR